MLAQLQPGLPVQHVQPKLGGGKRFNLLSAVTMHQHGYVS